MLKYEAHFYDDFLNLKIPATLWLAMLFGLKHIIILAASKLMPLEVFSIDWLAVQINPMLIIFDIPALIVLFSTGQRLPEAPKLMRQLWLNGRKLLLLSYLGSMLMFIALHWDLVQSLKSDDLMLVCSVLIFDLFFLVYLYRTDLVIDLFNEFPEAKNKTATK